MFFERQDVNINHEFARKNQSYCLFGESHDPSKWPEKTDILCWHCCHPFTTVPVSYPTRIMKRAKGTQWVMRGVFCSVGCCKRHVGDSMVFNSPTRLMWINMFANIVLGIDRPETIRPAPAREFLKAFGGSMSIREFRGGSKSTASPRPLVYPFESHSMMSRNAEVQKTTESIEQSSVRRLTRPKAETPAKAPELDPTETDTARFDKFVKEHEPVKKKKPKHKKTTPKILSSKPIDDLPEQTSNSKNTLLQYMITF